MLFFCFQINCGITIYIDKRGGYPNGTANLSGWVNFIIFVYSLLYITRRCVSWDNPTLSICSYILQVQTISLVSSTIQLNLNFDSVRFGGSFSGSLFGFSVTDIILTGAEISNTVNNWQSITNINRVSYLLEPLLIPTDALVYDHGTGIFSVQVLIPSTVQVVYQWFLNGVPQGSEVTVPGTGSTETFIYAGHTPIIGTSGSVSKVLLAYST